MQFFHFASGVFKVDVKKARYADLFSLAKKWSNDGCFYSLIIRKVSRINYGIQFLYYSSDSLKTIDMYRREIEELYGIGEQWVYAVDCMIHTSVAETPDDIKKYLIEISRIQENVLVQRDIKRDSTFQEKKTWQIHKND